MTEIKSAGVVLIVLMSLLSGFIVFGVFGVSWMPKQEGLKRIYLAGVPLYVEIADSKEKYLTGLSKKTSIADNEGMLFILPESARWQVTTEGLNFPIDIFWLDSSKKIVDIVRGAIRYDTPNIYSPKIPAKYIIETVADFADIYNIQIGDKARF